MFHGQQVLAGGDARAAVHDHFRRVDGPCSVPPRDSPQLSGGSIVAVFGEVRLEEMIRLRPGYGRAARSIVSLRPSKRSGARASTRSIDGSAELRTRHLDAQPHLRTRTGREGGWRLGSSLAERGRTTFAHPLCPAAVEQRDRVVTEIAQRPPQPARVHAVVLVVRDHLCVA